MQQQVFLPKRKKGGKVIVSRLYRGRYKLDGDSKPVEVSLGVTNETAARQKLAAIVTEVEQERAGVIAPRIQREAAKQALSEILELFIRSRETLGRDHKYLTGVAQQMERLIREAGWKHARDITLDSFETWRTKQTYSPKTLNDYLTTANVFLNWMVKTERILSNPLKTVEKVSTSNYEKRTRRAVSWEQVLKLQSVSGARGIIYLVAACTGLRRGEIEKLQWRDVKLEGDKPAIHARASTTKNGRKASIPLHPEALKALEAIRPSDVNPLGLVFPDGLPRIERFRIDLELAGIPYEDGEGRIFDFHALRNTFATLLAANGASPRDTMELMRHSDMRLTTQVYTDTGHLPLRESILKISAEGKDTLQDTHETHEKRVFGVFTNKSELRLNDLSGMDPEQYVAFDSQGFIADYALRWLGGGVEQDPYEMVRGAGFEPATLAV
jgi:integrase